MVIICEREIGRWWLSVKGKLVDGGGRFSRNEGILVPELHRVN